MPGAGSKLVKRHHRSRPRIDDLAAHTEIGQHAFERGRVFLQNFVADGGATEFARLTEKIERRQNIAAVRAACRPCGRTRLARGARRGRRLIGVFVVVLLLRFASVRSAVEARLDPPLRSGGAAP